MLGVLKRSGMTRVHIARAVHVQASSITRWISRESVPSFRAGAALLTLVHQKVPAALPREGLALVWHLTPVVSCSLDASSTIVSDLNSQLLT